MQRLFASPSIERKIKIQQIAKGVQDAIVLMLALIPLELLYSEFDGSSKADILEQNRFQESFCQDLTHALLIAPLVEEFICRGIILHLLSKSLNCLTKLLHVSSKYADATAILGQAIYFSYPHYTANQVPTFFKGLAYGYIGLFNPSHLLGSFAAHSLHNAIALVETCVVPEGDFFKALGLKR